MKQRNLSLKTDIFQKISLDFGDQASQAIKLILDLDTKTKGLVSDRLIRCIAYLSKGDLKGLERAIEMSRLDPRDVFLNAEYTYPDTKHIRDFNKTFHELGLMIC